MPEAAHLLKNYLQKTSTSASFMQLSTRPNRASKKAENRRLESEIPLYPQLFTNLWIIHSRLPDPRWTENQPLALAV